MSPAPATRPRLQRALDALGALHGPPDEAPGTSAWAHVLWDNCCYLAPDDRRAAAFELLRRATALDPARILAAPDGVLLEVTAHGIAGAQFAAKLRACARTALDHHGGDLDASLRAMTPAAARRALRAFPGVGEPGAEKVLLYASLATTCALESNGLRVLERLGYVAPDASYARAWKAARVAVAGEAPTDRAGLVALYALLRRHGQAVCTRARPRCGACPLAGPDVACPFPGR